MTALKHLPVHILGPFTLQPGDAIEPVPLHISSPEIASMIEFCQREIASARMDANVAMRQLPPSAHAEVRESTEKSIAHMNAEIARLYERAPVAVLVRRTSKA